MKILIVSQYYWPENFRINDLAQALHAKGHEVTVLTGMPNYPAGKIFKGYTWWRKRKDYYGAIPVVRVPLFARRQSKGWQLVMNYISFMFAACLLAPWLLRKQKFDVVFCYEPSPVTVAIPAILLAKLKKAPMFFWVQDLWPESLSATGGIKSPWILSIVGKMVTWIYKKCDYILLQSKSFFKPVKDLGAEPSKLYYFPNWAEALYHPVSLLEGAKERQEVPNSGFVVMFAGNLGAAQSLDSIVEAAEQLREENIHWVFLGDGRQREWLEKEVLIRSLGKVHVLGSRPMETMPAYFSLAGAMLVTLKADPAMSTTIPGKMQSYLACGRPVIAALNGAGTDVIDESGAGYAAASGDVNALVNVVLQMSKLEVKERERMGENARIFYEQNFDRDMLIAQLETWMRESTVLKR